MGQDEGKKAAAARAVRYVKSGMVVGLGTGSTSMFFLDQLAERVKIERLAIRGVPTSEVTARKAAEYGIPLVEADAPFGVIDLTVDGADEVDPRGYLVKGGGGALLREKLVALASERVLIIVDPAKHVPVLGKTFKLPVEIVRFGWARTVERLGAFGLSPVLRKKGDTAFVTDGNNHIADCTLVPDANIEGLARDIKMLPGVVEHGLFLGIADLVVTGTSEGGFKEQRFGKQRLAPLA